MFPSQGWFKRKYPISLNLCCCSGVGVFSGEVPEVQGRVYKAEPGDPGAAERRGRFLGTGSWEVQGRVTSGRALRAWTFVGAAERRVRSLRTDPWKVKGRVSSGRVLRAWTCVGAAERRERFLRAGSWEVQGRVSSGRLVRAWTFVGAVSGVGAFSGQVPGKCREGSRQAVPCEPGPLLAR